MTYSLQIQREIETFLQECGSDDEFDPTVGYARSNIHVSHETSSQEKKEISLVLFLGADGSRFILRTQLSSNEEFVRSLPEDHVRIGDTEKLAKMIGHKPSVGNLEIHDDGAVFHRMEVDCSSSPLTCGVITSTLMASIKVWLELGDSVTAHTEGAIKMAQMIRDRLRGDESQPVKIIRATATDSIVVPEDPDAYLGQAPYAELLAGIRQEFAKRVDNGRTPLFTTDAADLYSLILRNIPVLAKQRYNCNACRAFVNTYGGLVTIDEKTGSLKSAMWDFPVPTYFRDAVDAILRRVNAAKITGVFLTKKKQLGIPLTGTWQHLAVDMPKNPLITPHHTAAQISAEKAENHRMLCEAVKKYRKDTVRTAVNLLRTDALYRGEKVLGVAEWFLDVLQAIKGSQNADNILWYKAATAPVGYCHVSSSMIGTLLDDLEAGLDYETVKRKFADKMHPKKYQRPQVPPKVGNAIQAEKLVEQMKLEDSLKRRFARLEELPTLWKPRTERKEPRKPTGIFANIVTKMPPKMAQKLPVSDKVVDSSKMTWEKFQRTVLPTAREIEFLVPGDPLPYCAMVTAVNPSAPPILQWDTPEKRNPFSWYVYVKNSSPADWMLSRGYVPVTGIVLQPNLWTPGYEHHGKAVMFLLKGAKDLYYQEAGIGLFPAILKPELHEVRATIEAYSESTQLEGYAEASACGLRLADKAEWNATFRVTGDFGTKKYTLDRWD